MDFDLESLNIELRELEATPLQRSVLRRDVPRARAAIGEAVKRGAGDPIAYALSLFNSEAFRPAPAQKPKPVNLHAELDPRYSDDGERIWQASEVDESWRRGYLADCIEALRDEREPAARYQPSDVELSRLGEQARVEGFSNLRTTGARALAAWGRVWGFAELEAQATTIAAIEPGLEDEPSLDEEPVLA